MPPRKSPGKSPSTAVAIGLYANEHERGTAFGWYHPGVAWCDPRRGVVRDGVDCWDVPPQCYWPA